MITTKDATLALAKLTKQSISKSALQLNQTMKEILKPPEKARKALKKIGIEQ